MENQYIIVTCNPGNEDLVKFEISERFPQLHLSFSKSGFISFKNTKNDLTLDHVSLLPIWFARRVSLFLEKCKGEQLDDRLKSICQENDVLAIHKTDLIDHTTEVTKVKDEGISIIDLYRIGKNEYWLSIHKNFEPLSKVPNASYMLELPEESPSRAWLKIAEAIKRFNIDFKNQVVMEIGSAPGGASYRLLEDSKLVIGVDPGEMSDICMNHDHFVHLKRPVQSIEKKDFIDTQVDWITVDLNLPAYFSVSETARVAKFFGSTLKGIVCTIKMPRPEGILEINRFIRELTDCGIVEHHVVQLESHKREILFFGKTALAH